MSSISFLLTTVLTIVLFCIATKQSLRFVILLMGWLLIIGIPANANFFLNTTAIPPRFLIALIVTLILSVILFRRSVVEKMDQNRLIAIHIVRLPVELILYNLFVQKLIPSIMTYEGWNFDIIMGVTAICILLIQLLSKTRFHKRILIAWNVSGIILLTTIVSIAILSSPLPIQQFAFEQPNIAVLQFPYVYLPTCIVPMVYLSHFFALKKLMNQEQGIRIKTN
ncbi:MAG: hypothetical protein EOO02_04285 [Chitinophagaceae bacterium]|nr:MAG: hypothetical protein EOO02_04285 [Chitinophagaceae bacterium]